VSWKQGIATPFGSKVRQAGLIRAEDIVRLEARRYFTSNACVLGWAQQEQKSCVEQKGKSSFDSDFQYEYEPWKRGLLIL
jgi:hypothetical protein